jgi:hypothetical protein
MALLSVPDGVELTLVHVPPRVQAPQSRPLVARLEVSEVLPEGPVAQLGLQTANLLEEFGVLLLASAICLAIGEKATALTEVEQYPTDLERLEPFGQGSAAQRVRVFPVELLALPGDAPSVIGWLKCNLGEEARLDEGSAEKMFPPGAARELAAHPPSEAALLVFWDFTPLLVPINPFGEDSDPDRDDLAGGFVH